MAAGGPVKLQNGASGGGFAAARLTYQAEGLALFNIERYAIDRFDGPNFALKNNAFGDRKVHLKVLDVNQRIAIGNGGLAGQSFGGVKPRQLEPLSL